MAYMFKRDMKLPGKMSPCWPWTWCNESDGHVGEADLHLPRNFTRDTILGKSYFDQRCIWPDDLSNYILTICRSFRSTLLILSCHNTSARLLHESLTIFPLQHCLMERATDQITISKDAQLSVELRIERDSSTQPSTSDPSQSSRIMSLSATQTVEMPLRQKDLPTIQNSRGENSCSISNLCADHAAIQAPVQPKEPDDCLLLEYQDQLIFLETMNQRTSQRTRKLR